MARRTASTEQIADAADRWTDDQLACRAFGHNWQPFDAEHVKRLRYYRITLLCRRCTMRRYQEISERGIVFATWYTAPAGYHTEGLGQIVGEGKGIVRIASITRSGVTEVAGRAKQDDLPRSAKTAQAIDADVRRLRAVQ